MPRRRTKLPGSLWQAAVELARQHGLYSVSHPLRLDYTGLKKRLEGVPRARQKAPKPTFVELIAPPPAPPEECIIEFEALSGGKMRIQWKAAEPPGRMGNGLGRPATAAGNLYRTTYGGGNYAAGVVFKLEGAAAAGEE